MRWTRDRIGGFEVAVCKCEIELVTDVVFHAPQTRRDASLSLVYIRRIRFNARQMLYEPTTLASITALLATSLREEYGVDPEPIFLQADLPLAPPESPQARYPLAKIRKLWALSREASGDEAIGLKTGWYAKPTHFYAFGYSWLASSTLLGGMQRFARYFQLMSTASVDLSLTETADSYALTAVFSDVSKAPPKEGMDCGMTALLALCDIVAEKKIRPIRVESIRPPTAHPEAYREALGAPIRSMPTWEHCTLTRPTCARRCLTAHRISQRRQTGLPSDILKHSIRSRLRHRFDACSSICCHPAKSVRRSSPVA